MATIKFDGFDKYRDQLAKLGKNADGIIKYACYDAAGLVADAIKSACPVRTGDLRNSISLTTYRNDNGYVNTKVEFAGNDRKGTSNQLKANVLESGTSKIPKRPFIRPAFNRVKKQAEHLIEFNLDKKMAELMK